MPPVKCDGVSVKRASGGCPEDASVIWDACRGERWSGEIHMGDDKAWNKARDCWVDICYHCSSYEADKLAGEDVSVSCGHPVQT